MYQETTAWIDSVNPVVVAVVFLIIAVVHFLPSIIAFARGHDKRVIILVLNFFLGWTVIVWVGLLIWAAKGDGASGSIIPS